MIVKDINTEDLLKVMKVAKSDEVEVIAEDNQVRLLSGNNNSYYVTYIVNGRVIENGSVAIGKKYLDLFGKREDVEIIDNVIIGQKRRVEIARAEVKQCSITEIDSGSLEKITTLNTTDMKELISNKYAMAKTDDRSILTGTYFKFEDNTVQSCTLDGYRLALREVSKDYEGSTEFIVPGEAIEALDRTNLVYYNIHINKNYVRFGADKLFITSKLLEGQYVNYNALLNSYSNKFLRVDAKELLTLLKSYKTRKVTLDISTEKTTVKAVIEVMKSKKVITKGKAHTEHYYEPIATIEDKTECEYIGDNLKIAFNPKYLIDALTGKIGDINIRLSSNVNPVLIEYGDQKDLVLPIRLV